MQNCAIFRNRRKVQRGPYNNGRDPPLKDTGSGKVTTVLKTQLEIIFKSLVYC